MRCPFCNQDNTRVVDSRPIEDSNAIRRRRMCDVCGRRFTTYEKVETIPLIVIKKDMNREQYDRSKIETGILRACHKRPVSAEKINEMVNKVETELFNGEEREIPSSVIGEKVMHYLKDLDQVAYVRFASIYREFKDVNTFMDELKRCSTNSGRQKMEVSNYIKMRDQMQKRFLTYDQKEIEGKYGFAFDDDYFYVPYLFEEWRVNRHTGVVEGSKDHFLHVHQGSFNETLTIFDLLCCGKKEIVLAGTYARTNSLKGTIKGRTIASGVHDSRAARYDGHVEQLKKACVSLSGKPYSPGDAAFVFHVFPFLPLVFQFWESDEEFPPVLKFMWDENVLDYLRFETLYYVMGDFLDALDQAFDACKTEA